MSYENQFRVTLPHSPYEAISLESLVGKDTTRLLKACASIWDKVRHPYQGCYASHCRKANGRFLWEVARFIKTEFPVAYPEEFEKEQLSRREWEDSFDKQFRIVFGIARRHGLHLKWHGKVEHLSDRYNFPCDNYPEMWTIYKNGEHIATING